MEKALILDLDNTLYNWMDAFAESFREQVIFLCEALDITEEMVLNDFKAVFKKYNSVEVPNAVYQLSIWKTIDLDTEECKLIQDKSLEIFLGSWKSNIKLFPKVEETLNFARKLDFLIIAYSDAFAFWIDFRLSALNIQKYFSRIYSMADDRISDFNLVLNSKRHCEITAVQTAIMKPNINILSQILIELNIDKKYAYFVGDSITKDIQTAKRVGICDIWAKYGLDYKLENGQLLSYITPWEKGKGGVNQLRERIVPTYTIRSFDEIKIIITKDL